MGSRGRRPSSKVTSKTPWTRVFTPRKRDLAAALIVQPAVRELQPPAVERGARREGDQEHEGRATSRGMDILYPATGPLVKTGERRSGAQTSGARLFRLRMAC